MLLGHTARRARSQPLCGECPMMNWHVALGSAPPDRESNNMDQPDLQHIVENVLLQDGCSGSDAKQQQQQQLNDESTTGVGCTSFPIHVCFFRDPNCQISNTVPQQTTQQRMTARSRPRLLLPTTHNTHTTRHNTDTTTTTNHKTSQHNEVNDIQEAERSQGPGD